MHVIHLHSRLFLRSMNSLSFCKWHTAHSLILFLFSSYLSCWGLVLCVTHVSCQGLVLCVTHVPCQGLVFLCVTDVSSGGLVLCVWGMCPSGTLYLGVFKAVTTLLFVQESPLSTSYYIGLRAVCLGNVSGCRIFSSLYFECLIPFSCRQWGFCKATFCESGERSLRVTLLWLV